MPPIEIPKTDDERKWELLTTLEHRRTQSDNVAWTVPALAVTAQAFLLTIALAPDTQPAGRAIAVVAGAIAVGAALHLLYKSRFNFKLYEAHIDRLRDALGLLPVRTKSDLLPQLAPNHWLWLEYMTHPVRNRFVVGWRATDVWVWSLRALLLLDVAIFVYAILEWVGADPNWLS